MQYGNGKSYSLTALHFEFWHTSLIANYINATMPVLSFEFDCNLKISKNFFMVQNTDMAL